MNTITELNGKTYELLPCPFCGGPAKLEKAGGRWSECHGTQLFYGVLCRNRGVNVGGTCCMEQVPSASIEAAVNRWNLRNGERSVALSTPTVRETWQKDYVGKHGVRKPHIWWCKYPYGGYWRVTGQHLRPLGSNKNDTRWVLANTWAQRQNLTRCPTPYVITHNGAGVNGLSEAVASDSIGSLPHGMGKAAV